MRGNLNPEGLDEPNLSLSSFTGALVVYQPRALTVYQPRELAVVHFGGVSSTTCTALVLYQPRVLTVYCPPVLEYILLITQRWNLVMRQLLRQSPLWNREDEIAMEDYTGHDFHEINSGVRSGGLLFPDLQQRVDVIDSALRKLPPFHGTVFRAVKLPPDIADTIRPGEVFLDQAFLSTSKRQDKAFVRNDGRPYFIFTILSKTGRDISSYSVYPDEEEVLFGRCRPFLIHSVVLDGIATRVTMEELVYEL